MHRRFNLEVQPRIGEVEPRGCGGSRIRPIFHTYHRLISRSDLEVGPSYTQEVEPRIGEVEPRIGEVEPRTGGRLSATGVH